MLPRLLVKPATCSVLSLSIVTSVHRSSFNPTFPYFAVTRCHSVIDVLTCNARKNEVDVKKSVSHINVSDNIYVMQKKPKGMDEY